MTKKEFDKAIQEIYNTIVLLNKEDETFVLQLRIMILRYIEKSRR